MKHLFNQCVVHSVGEVLNIKAQLGREVKRVLAWLLHARLPSACEWKTTTEVAVDGWKGLLSASISLAAENTRESAGSSLSVTLAGRAGSRANMGATMQWDRRHSGFTLKTTKSHGKGRFVALHPWHTQAGENIIHWFWTFSCFQTHLPLGTSVISLAFLPKRSLCEAKGFF